MTESQAVLQKLLLALAAVSCVAACAAPVPASDDPGAGTSHESHAPAVSAKTEQSAFKVTVCTSSAGFFQNYVRYGLYAGSALTLYCKAS